MIDRVHLNTRIFFNKVANKKIFTQNQKRGYPGSLFHITHWKAGSQWIYKILNHCASSDIVAPQYQEMCFLNIPPKPQKIYPTLYVTRQNFYSYRLPSQSTYFVIIRDLRDTLISSYFSFKVSHVEDHGRVTEYRKLFHELTVEEGLIFLINHWLYLCANIQQSWLPEKKKIIRYEDLLKSDVEILLPIIKPYLNLPRKEIKRIIIANRFEALTQGRKRGEEDIASHERKGVEGDWKNYFTERVKKEFKSKFGKLLIKTGYEHNSNW